MSYTYKALTLAWLTVFGLAALSGSGMITGRWVLLLVGAALVLPGLTLSLWSKPRGAAEAITTSQRPALAGPAMRDRSPREASGIDVKNEVARPAPFSGSAPDPAPWSRDARGAPHDTDVRSGSFTQRELISEG